jgi:hypothetical protein
VLGKGFKPLYPDSPGFSMPKQNFATPEVGVYGAANLTEPDL